MPIYEYSCTSCGAHLELLQKMSAEAPSECASCGKSDTMQKTVSQTSFQLKGGGWYSDLYGSPAPKESGEPKKAEEKESSPSKETSKETPKTEKI